MMKQRFIKDFCKVFMPVITLRVQGVPMRFLVDTGANQNQIATWAVELLEREKGFDRAHAMTGNQGTLTGMSGVPIGQSEICLEYCVDRKRYKDKFGLLPEGVFNFEGYGVKIAGALGTNFLMYHSIVIDYTTLTICSKGFNKDWIVKADD